MFKQLQLTQCNLCLEELYIGRQDHLTFQLIPHFHLGYPPGIYKVSATAISSLSQLLWEQTFCNHFPLLAFPFVPSLGGIMDAPSIPKRKNFYYKQHPLNFVPLPVFTGDASSHCLYRSRDIQPQPGTVSHCFFHSSSHPSLFPCPQNIPLPHGLYAEIQEGTNPV